MKSMQEKKQAGEDLPDEVYHAAKQGKKSAQEKIVRFHQEPVRGWIVAHCPPGGDADEIAQKTFVAALTRIDDFSVGTKFRAWLFTIARYQVMTERTRLRRLADYHSRYAPELLDRELERRATHQPDDWALERMDHLRDCLGKLTDTLQQIVNWRYHEEIPLAEMSKRTGRSVAAMKKQLWIARRKLQACIELKLAAQATAYPKQGGAS